MVAPALHALAQAPFGRNSSRCGRNVRALPENEGLARSRPSPGRLGTLPGLGVASCVGHRRCMQARCVWPHWSGGPGRAPPNSRSAASRAWSRAVAPPADSPGPFQPATPLRPHVLAQGIWTRLCQWQMRKLIVNCHPSTTEKYVCCVRPSASSQPFHP